MDRTFQGSILPPSTGGADWAGASGLLIRGPSCGPLAHWAGAFLAHALAGALAPVHPRRLAIEPPDGRSGLPPCLQPPGRPPPRDAPSSSAHVPGRVSAW